MLGILREVAVRARATALSTTRLAASGIRLRVLAEEWAEVQGGHLPDGLEPHIVDGRPGCAGVHHQVGGQS